MFHAGFNKMLKQEANYLTNKIKDLQITLCKEL